MKCPRDGTELITRRYEADIEVDTCTTCRGVWLDRGELEAIQNTRERDYSAELKVQPNAAELAYQQARDASQGPILCPKCGKEMSTREYAYCSQINIDVCPESCGVWLDKGELQALEILFERNDQPQTGVKALWGSLTSLLG